MKRMRKFFPSKASSCSLPDMSKPSARVKPYSREKVVKEEHAVGISGGVLDLNEVPLTLATTNVPIEGDQRKSYQSRSTSTRRSARKGGGQDSTITKDIHPPTPKYGIDDAAMKPTSEILDQYKDMPILGDKNQKIIVTPREHREWESGSGPQHQLSATQSPLDTNEMEQGEKESDHMESESMNHTRRLEQERREMMKIIDHTTTELKDAQHRNQHLEERNRHLTDQLAALSIQLQGVEAQHRQTLRLLEAKASALKGAQAFLTKEDSLSGADAIRLVDALNAEILQTAAFMADRLDDTERDLDPVAEDAKAAHDQTVWSIGEPMVRSLESRFVQPKPEDDPMRLQIALQFCMVHSCSLWIESWMPGCWREGKFLEKIYSRITEKEGQSVSGRWRAITRSHVKHLMNFDEHPMGFVVTDIGNILAVAGWSQRRLDEQGLRVLFQEKLTRIGTLTLNLQTTIGETITSMDIKTLLIEPNARFDPAKMEDGFSRDELGEKAGERVAGTTDMGLSRSMKGTTQILRKPNIVLCSALDSTMS